MKLEEIIRTGLSRVDTIAVKRTAINPALWLVGLITPLSLVLTAIIGRPVDTVLLRCGPQFFLRSQSMWRLCFATRIDCSLRNTGSGNKRYDTFTKRAGVPK